MRFNFVLFLVVAVTAVRASDHLWYPFTVFFDGVANKTRQVHDFVTDQEKIFLQNVSNGTKNMQSFFEKQQDNIENSLHTYENNIKDANDKVLSYLKDTNDRMKKGFQDYISTNPSDIWGALTNNGEDEILSSSEAALSTPGIIVAHGYPCESHTIVTADGYILTVHRIPRSPNSIGTDPAKTALLQHGVFASSADWVFAGPERSLAYLLADSGYDVWLANVRGNRYSREHTTLKTDSECFWNFTWHEIATQDLPAVIDHIHKIKGPEVRINYIGHSMGATVLFALLSSRPEYNDKLYAAYALAPVVFTSEMRGPVRALAPYMSNFGYVSTLLGSKEFLPRQAGRGWLGSEACNAETLDSEACKQFIFMLCGFDEEQFDKKMLPVFLAHIGSGTSTKTVVHFAQEISSGGRFQQFDYGATRNLRVYGNTTPPAYDLDKVTLPIALFTSENDFLSSEDDVKKLFSTLKQTQKIFYVVPFEKFNHLDFLWAKDVKKLLHEKFFEVLNNWNS